MFKEPLSIRSALTMTAGYRLVPSVEAAGLLATSITVYSTQ